jgi:hypothetical protein
MSDTKYNSWTNYATWRVNLEMFDGANWNDYYIGSFPEPYDLGLALKEHTQDLIYEAGGGEGNIAVDYALAFLSDVNWYEIAKHMIADNIEENQEIDLDGGLSAVNEQQEEITDGITTDLHRSTDSANP